MSITFSKFEIPNEPKVVYLGDDDCVAPVLIKPYSSRYIKAYIYTMGGWHSTLEQIADAYNNMWFDLAATDHAASKKGYSGVRSGNFLFLKWPGSHSGTNYSQFALDIMSFFSIRYFRSINGGSTSYILSKNQMLNGEARGLKAEVKAFGDEAFQNRERQVLETMYPRFWEGHEMAQNYLNDIEIKYGIDRYQARVAYERQLGYTW